LEIWKANGKKMMGKKIKEQPATNDSKTERSKSSLRLPNPVYPVHPCSSRLRIKLQGDRMAGSRGGRQVAPGTGMTSLTRRGNRVTRLFHFPALHFSAIEFGDLESQRQENDGQED
jgi:hypothetical protein